MSVVSTCTAKLTAPRTQVINNILTSPYSRLYNPENIFVSKDGGGAGNNWAQGYAAGERIYEEVMDMIEREAESSDSLEVCGILHLVIGHIVSHKIPRLSSPYTP